VVNDKKNHPVSFLVTLRRSSPPPAPGARYSDNTVFSEFPRFRHIILLLFILIEYALNRFAGVGLLYTSHYYNLYTYTRIPNTRITYYKSSSSCYYILPTILAYVWAAVVYPVRGLRVYHTHTHTHLGVRFLDHFSQTFSYVFMNILLHTGIVIFRLARLEYPEYLYTCGFFFLLL